MSKKTIQHADLNSPVARFAQARTATLRQDQTVDQALACLRGQQLAEKIVYFYVTDAASNLRGVVPVRRLLMSPPESRVGDIMVDRVISVPSQATVLEASELMLHHRLMALPVVDEHHHLLGVIDLTMFSDEFSGAAHSRDRDDAFQLIGVHVARSRLRSPWRRYVDRFPWLLCNVAGGIACALIASAYESLISAATVLALFIPVVLALAESVSIQSMTLAFQTQSKGGGSIWHSLWRPVRREAVTATLLGFSCGALVGLIAGLWRGDWSAALALTVSISVGMLIACLMGVILPGLVRRSRFDPKIASGPIVLAIADIATLSCFFWLAARLLD